MSSIQAKQPRGQNRWTGLPPGFYVVHWLDDGTFIPMRLMGDEIEDAKTGSFIYLGEGQTYTIEGTGPENLRAYPDSMDS